MLTPSKPRSSTASAARWWTCWTAIPAKTDTSSSWIPPRRTLRFSLLPRKSMSLRTLSGSTIRLIRLRPERPHRQNRLRQNQPRLSRLPQSRNERLASRSFPDFFKSASGSAGGAFLLWRLCCSYRDSQSGPKNLSFATLAVWSGRGNKWSCTISPLPSFAAASYCCGVALFSQEYVIHTRHSPDDTKLLAPRGIGGFPRTARAAYPEAARAPR